MEPPGLHVRKMIGSERIFEEDAFLGSLQLLHLAVASMFIVAAVSRQILLYCAIVRLLHITIKVSNASSYLLQLNHARLPSPRFNCRCVSICAPSPSIS